MTRRPCPARAALMSVSLAVLLHGCASKESPSTLLALPSPSSVDLPAQKTVAQGAAPLLLVGRLDIPEYWQSRSVRYRSDGITVMPWPDTYWAERVEVGLSRNFALEMERAAGRWQVCSSGCELGATTPAWRLKVVLPSMDYRRDARKLEATAHWTLIPLPTATRTGAQIVQGQLQLDVQAEGDTPQAQAQAMGALTRELATRIANELPK